MHEIGNERAAELYGGLDHRPPDTANDNTWLLYLQDKYEHRKWAAKEKIEVTNEEDEPPSSLSSKEPLAGSAMNNIPNKWGSAMDDFAQVSVFSKAAAPKKDLFGKIRKKKSAPSQKQSDMPPDLLDDSSTAPEMPPRKMTTTAAPVLPPSVDFFSQFGL